MVDVSKFVEQALYPTVDPELDTSLDGNDAAETAADVTIAVGMVVEVDGRPCTIVDMDGDEGTITVEFDDGEMAEIDMETAEGDYSDDVIEDPVLRSEGAEEPTPEILEARRVNRAKVVRGGKIVTIKAHTVKILSPAEKAARRRSGAKRRGRKLRAGTLRARAVSMRKRKAGGL